MKFAFPGPGKYPARCRCGRDFIAVVAQEDIEDGCTPESLLCPQCLDAHPRMQGLTRAGITEAAVVLAELREADSDAQWIAIDPPRNIIYDGDRWQRVTDAQVARLEASRDVVRCTGDCVAHCKNRGPIAEGDVVYHVMNGWRDIEARLKE